jgi:RimJ/RimL family protein N-acetyltransferase
MIAGTAVALGPILPVDLPSLYLWGDDLAIASTNGPYLPKNFQRESDFWLNAAGDSTRIFFAIRKRCASEIIGHLQITAIEIIHRSATLGILIGAPENRDKGYGRDAMRLAIDYCWHHLNLSRLALNVHSTNARAIRMYERLGFETEGVLRQVQFIAGNWIDIRMMALLRPDR